MDWTLLTVLSHQLSEHGYRLKLEKRLCPPRLLLYDGEYVAGSQTLAIYIADGEICFEEYTDRQGPAPTFTRVPLADPRCFDRFRVVVDKFCDDCLAKASTSPSTPSTIWSGTPRPSTRSTAPKAPASIATTPSCSTKKRSLPGTRSSCSTGR